MGTQPLKMLKTILAAVALVACGFAFSSDEFAFLRGERVGDLRIGLSEVEARKAVPCALKRGPLQKWEADGAYHQSWEFAGCGITLGMVSAKKNAPKTVESITLSSPGTLSTRRGIRIGSTEQEVMAAYKPEWNREESKDFGGFVAGSVYGGLIFDFENGRVSRIFLGAAAE